MVEEVVKAFKLDDVVREQWMPCLLFTVPLLAASANVDSE